MVSPVGGGDLILFAAIEIPTAYREGDEEEEEEEGHTHLRDFHLSFSMLFSGPSLSYDARHRAAENKRKSLSFIDERIPNKK